MRAQTVADLFELADLDSFCSPSSTRLSQDAYYAFWGGYRGPHWQIDRRPEPLRSRRIPERLRAMLRRRAVAVLRIEGHSFRKIGERLEISHVAAWKLWTQVYEDLCRFGSAMGRGQRRLREAVEAATEGDVTLLAGLRREAIEHLGSVRFPWD